MPDLSSQEEIELSIAQNVALSVEAMRKQEQNEVEAGQIQNADKRFTLFQRRVVFGFEVALTVILLIVLLFLLATDRSSLGALLSGAGALGSFASLMLRQRPSGPGV